MPPPSQRSSTAGQKNMGFPTTHRAYELVIVTLGKVKTKTRVKLKHGGGKQSWSLKIKVQPMLSWHFSPSLCQTPRWA